MADDGQDIETLLAISHPLRRRLLRALVDSGEPLSLSQLARAIDLPVATVRYHANVLCGFGAAEPASPDGRGDHLYDAAVDGDPRIEALLEETRAADEGASGLGEDG